ncbi:MAG: hypothetical protein ABMA02_08650 [Saprospiraceae bacterium]
MKIYFDENTFPQLAHGLRLLQEPLNTRDSEPVEVVYLPDEFGKGAKDEDWIPQLGATGAVIITHDLNIHRTRSQRELYEAHGLGAFFFTPPSQKSGFGYWDFVQQVIKKWDEIKRLSSSKAKRPFAYRYTIRSSKAERM